MYVYVNVLRGMNVYYVISFVKRNFYMYVYEYMYMQIVKYMLFKVIDILYNFDYQYFVVYCKLYYGLGVID